MWEQNEVIRIVTSPTHSGPEEAKRIGKHDAKLVLKKTDLAVIGLKGFL